MRICDIIGSIFIGSVIIWYYICFLVHFLDTF